MGFLLVGAGAVLHHLFHQYVSNGLATGVVGSLGYWIAQQGVKRGGQPIYYYALVGWLYEFLPAFLSLCGITTIFYNLFRRPATSWLGPGGSRRLARDGGCRRSCRRSRSMPLRQRRSRSGGQ